MTIIITYDDVYDYHIKIILSRCLLKFVLNLCDCVFFTSFRYIKQPKTMSKEKEKERIHDH